MAEQVTKNATGRSSLLAMRYTGVASTISTMTQLIVDFFRRLTKSSSKTGRISTIPEKKEVRSRRRGWSSGSPSDTATNSIPSLHITRTHKEDLRTCLEDFPAQHIWRLTEQELQTCMSQFTILNEGFYAESMQSDWEYIMSPRLKQTKSSEIYNN